MVPWNLILPLVTQGIGMLGKNYLNKRYNYTNPAQFQNQLTLSNADLAGMRSQNLQNIGMLNARNISEIKRLGAARRLPSGAITSALAGAGYEASKGAAAIEPQLKQAQIASYTNYLNMLRPYEQLQAQQLEKSNIFSQEGLGNIFKTILLWKAGLLGAGNDQSSQKGTGFGLKYRPKYYAGLNLP